MRAPLSTPQPMGERDGACGWIGGVLPAHGGRYFAPPFVDHRGRFGGMAAGTSGQKRMPLHVRRAHKQGLDRAVPFVDGVGDVVDVVLPGGFGNPGRTVSAHHSTRRRGPSLREGTHDVGHGQAERIRTSLGDPRDHPGTWRGLATQQGSGAFQGASGGVLPGTSRSTFLRGPGRIHVFRNGAGGVVRRRRRCRTRSTSAGTDGSTRSAEVGAERTAGNGSCKVRLGRDSKRRTCFGLSFLRNQRSRPFVPRSCVME
eukprot:scaffold116_cov334-Pavlova_lutheri.AAC.42